MKTYQSDSQISLNDAPSEAQNSRREFVGRVLIVVGMVTAVAVLLVFLWFSVEVILLVFAGVVLAVFLNSLTNWLSRLSGLSHTWALTVILLVILIITAAAGWFLFPTLKEQVNLLSTELPRAFNRLRETISQFGVGQWFLDQFPQKSPMFGSQSSNILTRITGYFSTALGVIVNVLIILATGIYFAFNPSLYRSGLVKLFPAGRQKRVREVIDTLGITLQRWLIGRFIVSAINGALTVLGLWMLGMPIPFLLGFFTGICNFIPNIGPLLAAVPAVLLAWTQGEQQAVYVAILFLFIQNLEGFVLSPLVQEKSISLPPVLVLSSQLMLGVLFGFLGVLLAGPITAVGYVLVKMLYVEDLLGNEVKVQGESKAKENQAQNKH